jgi:hypothetical protein
MIDISRLQVQLQRTRLQNKDNPLYQLLHELINSLNEVNNSVNTISGTSSTGTVVNNTTQVVQQIISGSEYDGGFNNGIIAIPGPKGEQGSSGSPIFMLGEQCKAETPVLIGVDGNLAHQNKNNTFTQRNTFRQLTTFISDIHLTGAFYLDGGVDTFIQESSADNVIFVVGGSTRLQINNTSITASILSTFSAGIKITGGTVTGAGAIRFNGNILDIDVGSSGMRIFDSTDTNLYLSIDNAGAFLIRSTVSNYQFTISRSEQTNQGLRIKAGGGEVYYDGWEGTDAVNATHIWTSTKGSTTIEQMRLAGAGVLTVAGFGSHAFSAGGAGGNVLTVRNTSAGNTNAGKVWVGNDASASLLALEAYSSTFTPGSYNLADGAAVFSTGVGGLSLMASDASGVLRFLAGGTTIRFSINTNGDWLKAGNIMDAVATPTFASGGGGATITGLVGNSYAFYFELNNAGTSVTINFGRTYTNSPIVTAGTNDNVAGFGGVPINSVSTSQVEFNVTGMNTGTKFWVLVRGY